MTPSLRPGDIVELRPPSEILATLDSSGCLAGLPFMPEMIQYFGRRFTVSKRAEKICDTICPIGQRRMRDTVYLDDLRCDGTGPGRCEAAVFRANGDVANLRQTFPRAVSRAKDCG